MRYAQIASGQKLHLVCEAGEEYRGEIIHAGHVSAPLCRTPRFDGNYRMTINVPLANACRNCLRVHKARRAG
jgi:hypothetical protein